MRILHTSDWHLGKSLAGYSRAAEHAAFLDELVDLARDVDLILVSGDVFDTYNPPIESEELLYDALARLGDGGRRAVVVIAGNHDSPDRLAAPAPLGARHGVFILGRPGDVPSTSRSVATSGRVRARARPSLLELDLPRGERAIVAALPYPSESRLRTLLSASMAEVDRRAAYETRVAAAFEQLAAHFEPGAVNLATSHLSVVQARPSESERMLVGGATAIRSSALPAAAQYVALGHLHYPQAVADAPTVARYAGAPLAFRMSERDYPHSHCLVEVTPGGTAHVELIPISAGRPLVRWEASCLEEVVRGCEEGLHRDAFIELAVRAPEPLDHSQLALLRSLGRDFVRIRAVVPEAEEEELPPPEVRRALPADELFRAFYREQSGEEPDEAVVELFLELAAAARAEPLHDEDDPVPVEPLAAAGARTVAGRSVPSGASLRSPLPSELPPPTGAGVAQG